MKKVILLVVSLVFVASLFAEASGEAYMQYPLIGYEDATDEDGGLVQGYVGIGYWGADYGFHFNFNNTAWPSDDWTINHAFKKFKLHEYVNLLVGKTAVPIVKQNNPSGFANINIIEDACWGFINPTNDFMVKFDGKVSELGWQLYTANVNESANQGWDYANYGARFDYTVAGAEIGAALEMVGVADSIDSMMNWAFDVNYTVIEKIGIQFQLVNWDEDPNPFDSIDLVGMNYYATLHYTPGFKGIKPYFGMLTYAEMEENEMFFGANFNPTEDSVLKLEYKMYSLEDTMNGALENDLNADTLTLQLGFSF